LLTRTPREQYQSSKGDEPLRKRIGQNGRESVKQRFLLTRYLERYLDLFGSFERFSG
jgi:hypothetical protein